MKTLLEFLAKRFDWISKAVQLLVVAAIRELGAISNADSLLGLSKEFRESHPEWTWLYWPLRILEVIFVGGSWTIFGALVALMLVLLVFKFLISRSKPHERHLLNSQLRGIEKDLRNFKNKTALEHCKRLLDDVSDTEIDSQTRVQLEAKAYHLMGRARILCSDVYQTFKYHLEAYKRDTDNPQYHDRALISFFRLDQKQKSIQLAQEALKSGHPTERTYAILLATGNVKKESIPKRVLDAPDFKQNYIYLIDYSDPKKIGWLLEKEITERKVPRKVTLDNVDYWNLVAQHALGLALLQNKVVMLEVKQPLIEADLIEYASKVYSSLQQKIQSTEFSSHTGLGRLIEAYHWLSSYLVTGKPSDALQLKRLLMTPSTVKLLPLFREHSLVALNQCKLYQDVIELADHFKEKEMFVHLLKFSAHGHLGDFQKMKIEFITYISLVERVGGVELINILLFVNQATKEGSTDLKIFYDDHLTNKAYEQPVLKDLCFGYIFLSDESAHQQIEGFVPSLIDSYPSLREELRLTVLIILKGLKKTETIIELIEKFHAYRKGGQVLYFLIESLLEQKGRTDFLLELLKIQRQFKPIYHLLQEELQIHKYAGNYDAIQEVAEVGLQHFEKDQELTYDLIYALYKARKKEKLGKLLTDELHDINFSRKRKFGLAQIAIGSGKVDLGLEIAYRETKANFSNPLVKQNYFQLNTIYVKEETVDPLTVSVGTTIQAMVETNEAIIEVSSDSVQIDPIAQRVIGKRAGDNFTVGRPLSGEQKSVKIIRILDKYTGLLALITQELNSGVHTGMNIQSISFKDVAEMAEILKKRFGSQGDERRIQRDQALLNYGRAEISFTELTRIISYDNPLSILTFLTSPFSDGFQCIPKKLNYQLGQLPDQVVIDATTLPALKVIFEKIRPEPTPKLIISQYLVDHIKDELNEAEVRKAEHGFMQITSFDIIPVPVNEESRLRRIESLRELLRFVENYCMIEYSTERLNILRANPGLYNELDWYFNYIMDTSCLATDRVLVSDDAFFVKHFGFVKTCGIDYFVEQRFKDKYESEIMPILIENHYVGLTLTASVMSKEFKKPTFGRVDTMRYCIENLPFHRHIEEKVFESVIDFVKLIYIDDQVHPDQRSQISQSMFFHAMKGMNRSQILKLKDTLFKTIDQKFSLLQPQADMVKQDIIAALQIMNISLQ